MSVAGDLITLVRSLCTAGRSHSGVLCINDVVPFMGPRFCALADALQMRVDLLEQELCNELQNDRLFRLLCMLCTVVDWHP